MPLEMPREVPQLADSGARTKEHVTHALDNVHKLRFEFAALQAKHGAMKREADWGPVGGDAEAAEQGKVATAWLEDEYPKLQVEFMRRFGEYGYAPWADEVGHLHFYLAPPDVAFDEIRSEDFKRMIDSWASIQRVIQQHIRALSQRREFLLQEQQQERAAAFEDLGLFTPAELDRFYGVHVEEMRNMKKEIDLALAQLERKKEQMQILMDAALPYAERHGFVDVADIAEDIPRLVPAPSASGPRKISEAA